MSRITDIQLENVRCFEGVQSARIGRITLLVGENSSGKSTLLGCYRAIAKLANLNYLEETNHFDEPVFQLGLFNSIVRKGKSEFAVGAKFSDHCHESAQFVFFNYDNRFLDRKVKLEFQGVGGIRRNLEFSRPETPELLLHFRASEFEFNLFPGEVSYESISSWLSRYVRDGFLPYSSDLQNFKKRLKKDKDSRTVADYNSFLNYLSKELIFPKKNTFLTDVFIPEIPKRQRKFDSVPFYFAPQDEIDNELFEFLKMIGRDLNLWNAVNLVKTGIRNQYQILLETSNGPINLVDVGYGVHSLLHLLSKIYYSSSETVNLLQQPEVHLHPRAQSELAQWMANSDRNFIIETHSSHFVNWFRICVMNEAISPEEISLVYFQPSADGKKSKIYNIYINSQGNLEHEPAEYGSFFVDEAERLLGFKNN